MEATQTTLPRTLLVTNDYPPRVGGIQRTLEALWKELPPDRVSVLAPGMGGRRVVRRGRSRTRSCASPRSSSGRHPAFAARLDEVVDVARRGGGALRRRVPAGLARSATREAGERRTWSPPTGSTTGSRSMPGAHTIDAVHDVGGLARAGDVQRVHRPDGPHRRARGGAGVDLVSRRGSARVPAGPAHGPISVNGWGWVTGRSSCASAGSSPAKGQDVLDPGHLARSVGRCRTRRS